MTAVILDTETTGTDAPEVVEVCYLPINIHGSILEPGRFIGRFKPSKTIALGALAAHHILDEELVSCPPSSSFKLPDGTQYIIGHKVDFDWEAIGKPDVKRIDVFAMCRSLWPTADSHTQGAMMYMLERERARMLLREAHSAAADVMNCRTILLHVLTAMRPLVCENFEDLWETSERMRVPTVMSFGKHKGMAIKDLPRDYRAWMLRQPDMDEYVLRAVRASM